MKWRIIKLVENDAFLNMALDHAISESVAKGQIPTIRFYKWLPSAVSIGCFQSMNDEVDVKKCEEQGIDVVRRRTGGGAVYHDNKGEITYSVIAPSQDFPGITQSYHKICGWIVQSLALIGINSEFKPINDIIAGNKKISGNAQTRRSGIMLQHGTILHDVNVDTMFSLLKVPNEKIRDKMIAVVKDRVTRVLDFKEISQEETYNALLKGFTQDKEWEFGEVTESELNRAKELAQTLYKTKEWNFKR